MGAPGRVLRSPLAGLAGERRSLRSSISGGPSPPRGQHVDALVVGADGLIQAHQQTIVNFAARHRLPADIANSVFQVHGIDAAGEVVVRRRLSRGRILAFFEKLPRCLVGMEACNYNTSHF